MQTSKPIFTGEYPVLEESFIKFRAILETEYDHLLPFPMPYNFWLYLGKTLVDCKQVLENVWAFIKSSTSMISDELKLVYQNDTLTAYTCLIAAVFIAKREGDSALLKEMIDNPFNPVLLVKDSTQCLEKGPFFKNLIFPPQMFQDQLIKYTYEVHQVASILFKSRCMMNLGASSLEEDEKLMDELDFSLFKSKK